MTGKTSARGMVPEPCRPARVDAAVAVRLWPSSLTRRTVPTKGVRAMASKPAAHMGESDAFSWYMERDPLLRSTVVTVLLFDRRPDPVLLRDKAERASRIVPGLRHRLTEAPLRLAPPRWTVDADFDLSWHFRRIEAPRPGTLGGVLELARIAGMTAFDRAHPLWEWTSIDGLEHGRAALVLKHHHSLMDGIGGMQLAAQLFDLEPGSSDPGPMPDAPEPEHLSTPALVVDALSYDWQRLSSFASRHTTSLWGVARHAARRPGGCRRAHGEHIALDREDGSPRHRDAVAADDRPQAGAALRRPRAATGRPQTRGQEGRE